VLDGCTLRNAVRLHSHIGRKDIIGASQGVDELNLESRRGSLWLKNNMRRR